VVLLPLVANGCAARDAAGAASICARAEPEPVSLNRP
jgi:hypothetical protein